MESEHGVFLLKHQSTKDGVSDPVEGRLLVVV